MAIYDRLFQLITYEPEGSHINPFGKKETFIHFAKNEAMQPKAFKGMWTPTNVNADLGASELFANMVDKVSTLSLEWLPKDQPLSATYKSLVDGMNEAASARPSKEAVEAYNKASAYLNVTATNPFTGKPDGATTPSPDYAAYQKNLDELTGAYEDYQTAYNGFVDDVAAAEKKGDEDAKRKAQRDWNASEKSLRRDIKRAQDAITQGNGKWVQMALDTMNTTINDALARALEQARERVADGQFNASGAPGGTPWLLTYGSPVDWHEDAGASNFSEFTITSDHKVEDNSATSHAYNFSASYNAGLWGVKAKSEGKFEDKRHHMKGEKVAISCKVAKVSIVRPWFSELLFRSDNWYTNLGRADEKEYVSNGTLDSSNADKLIPMYPVAFIVARDITIEADFSEEDKSIISQAVSAEASVSWGPFSVGGGYKYGSDKEHLETSLESGKLRIPGMQVIGWVSRVMPACPRQSRADLGG
ncbi:hypothetical protein [Paracoccus sp. (in: a-proteobacteria)]|uniref:hypothetical protein n=1 Tax=Paracoccus sp. TaxID=267 RepID=UPI00321FA027